MTDSLRWSTLRRVSFVARPPMKAARGEGFCFAMSLESLSALLFTSLAVLRKSFCPGTCGTSVNTKAMVLARGVKVVYLLRGDRVLLARRLSIMLSKLLFMVGDLLQCIELLVSSRASRSLLNGRLIGMASVPPAHKS